MMIIIFIIMCMNLGFCSFFNITAVLIFFLDEMIPCKFYYIVVLLSASIVYAGSSPLC